jgi:hypothetical protein
VGPWKLLVVSLLLVAGGACTAVTGDAAGRGTGIAAIVGFGFSAVLAVRRLREARLASAPAWVPASVPASVPAPVPLPDEQRSEHWFVGEEADESGFTRAEQDLLAALRRDARRLPSGGVSSSAFRDDHDGALVAEVSLHDEAELLALGLRLAGGRVCGDALDSDQDPPTSLAMPASDADDPTAWLERILRRPVERLEWWHRGMPYATRYQFADTTEGLLEAFEEPRAPRGLPERLSRGHPGGRLRTAALGPPDAVIAVRVDGRHLDTPRLPDFLWHRCPLDQRPPG